MQRTDYTLKTDPEFRRLVAPLTLAEQNALEEEIFSTTRDRKICIWYNTILVDYTYYEYCELLQLSYETISIPYTSREEAVAWICENQLRRQNLPSEMWRYLIGKRSMTEIKLGAHEYASLPQRTTRRAFAINSKSKYDSSQTRTRERIGEQYGLGPSTVRKYEYYAIALEQLRETIPDFIDAHLAGKYKLSMDRVTAMSEMSPQELQKECELVIAETQLRIPTTWKKRLCPEVTKTEQDLRRPVTIKDMPEYDPDAEIASLALTIPSWVNTMNRVKKSADITATTSGGRERLTHALKLLNDTTVMMLMSIKEVDLRGLQ